MEEIKNFNSIAEFIFNLDKSDNKVLTVEELNFKHFLLAIRLEHEMEQENFLNCSKIKKDIELVKEELKNGKNKQKANN